MLAVVRGNEIAYIQVCVRVLCVYVNGLSLHVVIVVVVFLFSLQLLKGKLFLGLDY